MATILPTEEEKEELLLSCRYGDLEDIQAFVSKYGPQPLSDLRDEHGNTILHMICGNGHTDVLDYVGSVVPPTLISVQNSSQSTAMHWAALNQHLPIMQKLVALPGGPGIDLIDIKNSAGRSPLGEAEISGWQEGAQWLVQVMNIDTDEAKEEAGDDVIDGSQDVEVEIEDANGQIAKMKISGATGKPVDDDHAGSAPS
ncbi:hypothetical protein HWV62_24644 [Athelia sp. TMB]|nr:hypothetical protein HWV62_24644 [Athelia sp. TMB]